MDAGTRADGTLITMGASVICFTMLSPRLVDYALCVVLHVAGGLAALNMGTDSQRRLSRSTNFVAVVVISIAIAYVSERRRRENLLLTWRLRRARLATSRAGTCASCPGSAAHCNSCGCLIELKLAGTLCRKRGRGSERGCVGVACVASALRVGHRVHLPRGLRGTWHLPIMHNY